MLWNFVQLKRDLFQIFSCLFFLLKNSLKGSKILCHLRELPCLTRASKPFQKLTGELPLEKPIHEAECLWDEEM